MDKKEAAKEDERVDERMEEKPPMFAIHSIVRSRHNRTVRASVPMNNRHRFKQHVLSDQRRLVRKRPVVISLQQLEQNWPELLKKNQAGMLEVRTVDGRLVDLVNRRLAPVAQPPKAPVQVLDSVANDTPTGYVLPKEEGAVVLSSKETKSVIETMTSTGQHNEDIPDLPPPPDLTELNAPTEDTELPTDFGSLAAATELEEDEEEAEGEAEHQEKPAVAEQRSKGRKKK